MVREAALAAITIKDLPKDLHARLKEQAAINGRSLNREVLLLLKISLMQPRRRSVQELLSEAARVRRGFRGVVLDDEMLDRAKREGRP